MNLIEQLEGNTLLADGAMGTMLHSRGISFEKCFDELNLTDPGAVAAIHREYIEAGAQLILANTFGANCFKLSQHGLDQKIIEINQAGVKLARRVATDSSKDVLIAGDIGPLGVRIAPIWTRQTGASTPRVCGTNRSVVRIRRGFNCDRNDERPV